MNPENGTITDMRRKVFERIADDLRERITSGALSPGAQLPTHEDLMATHNASRGAVRRALEDLMREGLIEGRRPVGMFVRDRSRVIYQSDGSGFPPMFPGLDDGLLALLAGPSQTITQTISVALVSPPREIAERLQLGDRPAVLRHRIRSVAGRAVNIADAYYPHHLVGDNQEIMTARVIGRGVDKVLTELGLREVRRRVEMISGMPTPEEAKQLGLGPGTPVHRQIYTTRTADDVPVHCSISVLPGDLCILVCEQELEPELPSRVLRSVSV